MKRFVYCSLLCLLALMWVAGDSAADTPKKPKPDKAAKEAKLDKAAKPSEEAKTPKKVKATTKEAKPSKPDKPDKALKAVPGKKKPATIEVKKGPLKIEVSLKGVFEAQKAAEVIVRPKVWTKFQVLKAVEHGSRVKRGDLLVQLDMEKIDQSIADMRTQRRLSALAMKQAEHSLRTLEAMTPLELAAVARGKRIANEDFAEFFKTGLPTIKKLSDFSYKVSKQTLEYYEEELRQLEKMYKADDLTEETEEIILKRSRDRVERARFLFGLAKLQHEKEKKYDMPRQEEGVKVSAKRQNLTADQAKAVLPIALQKQRLAMEKMKVERERSDKKFERLLADRAMMTIKAPADGIVYYGQCVDGKWTGGGGKDKFKRGASIGANQVFMTIVKPRPLRIVAQVPEKDLHHVNAGLKGTARPTGYPDMKLDVIVAEVASIPTSGTNYQSRITVAENKKAEQLMPGMTCGVKFVVYLKKDALTVPLKAVADDPLDDEKHYVHVVDKKGKTKKQAVKLGKRADKRVEILKGLKPGDKILAEPPKKDGK